MDESDDENFGDNNDDDNNNNDVNEGNYDENYHDGDNDNGNNHVNNQSNNENNVNENHDIIIDNDNGNHNENNDNHDNHDNHDKISDNEEINDLDKIKDADKIDDNDESNNNDKSNSNDNDNNGRNSHNVNDDQAVPVIDPTLSSSLSTAAEVVDRNVIDPEPLKIAAEQITDDDDNLAVTKSSAEPAETAATINDDEVRNGNNDGEREVVTAGADSNNGEGSGDGGINDNEEDGDEEEEEDCDEDELDLHVDDTQEPLIGNSQLLDSQIDQLDKAEYISANFDTNVTTNTTNGKDSTICLRPTPGTPPSPSPFRYTADSLPSSPFKSPVETVKTPVLDKISQPSPVNSPSPIKVTVTSSVKTGTSTAVKSTPFIPVNTSISVVQTTGLSTSTGFRDTVLRAPESHSSSQLTPCIAMKNKTGNTDKSAAKSVDTDMTENIKTPQSEYIPSPVGATKGTKCLF
jgi:hypothetical protein